MLSTLKKSLKYRQDHDDKANRKEGWVFETLGSLEPLRRYASYCGKVQDGKKSKRGMYAVEIKNKEMLSVPGVPVNT